MRSLIAALTLLALLAPPALADPDRSAAEAFARAQWPDSPCSGHEQIDYQGEAAVDSHFPGALAEGWINDPACRVDVASSRIDTTALLACVLAHEFGHVAGFQHDSGQDWMNPDMPLMGICERQFPEPPAAGPDEGIVQADEGFSERPVTHKARRCRRAPRGWKQPRCVRRWR